jgi:hypothetical protein
MAKPYGWSMEPALCSVHSAQSLSSPPLLGRRTSWWPLVQRTLVFRRTLSDQERPTISSALTPEEIGSI